MNALSSTLTLSELPWHARKFIDMLGRITAGTLQLTTPEGLTLEFGNGVQPRATIEIRSWWAVQKILRNGDIGLAECYRDGLIATDDLTALLRFGIQNQDAVEKAIHGHPLLQLGYRLRHILRRNSKKGSKRNIEAHYDLGNDFYRLWLDSTMTYSSACFNGDYTLDLNVAQANKYQQLVDMSGAKPGETILEIGCGWGGFAEHAARRGIAVHGITLSHEQLHYARERIKQAGLEHLATFELRDYRDTSDQYDHIVSIEMLEAVGERYWKTYFNQLHSLLKPGGSALIQTITIGDQYFESYRKGTDFIQQYIFPGGMLPSVEKLQQLTDSSRLSIEERTEFGRDYAETLRRWGVDFERQLKSVRKLGFDEEFIRLWRFYLSYCEAGFDEGRIDVIHLHLKRDDDHVRPA